MLQSLILSLAGSLLFFPIQTGQQKVEPEPYQVPEAYDIYASIVVKGGRSPLLMRSNW